MRRAHRELLARCTSNAQGPTNHHVAMVAASHNTPSFGRCASICAMPGISSPTNAPFVTHFPRSKTITLKVS